jgi:hypothetical protein
MASRQHRPGASQKAPTADQRRAWEDMCVLSAAWNNLAEEQRQAWNAESRSNRRGGYAARTRRRSGRRLFMKVNFHRLALGEDLLPRPPGPESLAPIPSVQFVIIHRGGRLALKVIVSDGLTEGIMVSASRPCNAGVMVCKKFVRICLLPAPKRGMSDFTRDYVAKHGWPPVGKKIFIRIQQMKDYTGSIVQVLSAIVPAESSGRGQAKRA